MTERIARVRVEKSLVQITEAKRRVDALAVKLKREHSDAQSALEETSNKLTSGKGCMCVLSTTIIATILRWMPL